MPYVSVQITADGNTAEQKHRVIEGITQVLVKELGEDPNGTVVVIEEIHPDNWGWKGTSLTRIRQARAVLSKAARKPAPIGKGARRNA